MIFCNSIQELKTLSDTWKTKGERIVFTNGVFDILHLGHVDYLQRAKQLGDRLVVAINDDSSVKKLSKGPERPINPEEARARVVGALRCVDATLIFREDTPIEVIRVILPDILVKGGDYDAAETDENRSTYIVGSKEVQLHGGHVVAIPLVPGFSTTGIVTRLRQ